MKGLIKKYPVGETVGTSGDIWLPTAGDRLDRAEGGESLCDSISALLSSWLVQGEVR